MLGDDIADKMVSITGKPIDPLKAAELQERQVWMEVCAQTRHARH